MNKDGPVGHVLSAATDNLPSRLYLGVCAALIVWAAVDTYAVDHADASFAGVIPVLATAPTSFVLLALPGLGGPLLFAGLAVAALVNAAVLGLVVRHLRRRTAHSRR